MHPIVKIFLKVLFFIFLLISTYLIAVIGIAVISDYQPENITELDISNQTNYQVSDSTYTLLTWNIGFCGLGKEMDFFYDGGKMVRPTSAQVKKYTKGVLSFLKSADSLDFILLQEVDKNSDRTGRQDQTQIIQNNLSRFSSSFGINYKVQFVPLPFTNPLGKVEMGQMILSKHNPVSSQRHSFYAAYSWPKRLFMLDRCFVVSRFLMNNGKELVLLNTHNSAYDTGGKLRDIEMPLIRNVMIQEFNKGNFVIAGGDWNQNPPNFKTEEIEKTFPAVNREVLDSTLFPENWQIVYDPNHATNREIEAPLTKHKTKVTIIDYFIVSPNIQIKKIKTLTQAFSFSDHEPVLLQFQINK